MRSYTQEEIQAMRMLERATKNTVMKRKYLSVCLHMEGYTNKNIAKIVGINEMTVGIYINAYRQRGTEGLIPKKQTGRPKFLTEEQEQRLYETIREKTPNDVGFDGMMNWTSKLACGWVDQEFGIQYSINGMLDLFHRLNLSYTRPTYVLAKADPEKQKQFLEDFEVQKKTHE